MPGLSWDRVVVRDDLEHAVGLLDPAPLGDEVPLRPGLRELHVERAAGRSCPLRDLRLEDLLANLVARLLEAGGEIGEGPVRRLPVARRSRADRLESLEMPPEPRLEPSGLESGVGRADRRGGAGREKQGDGGESETHGRSG
jgi:hypothetical protein